MSFIEKITDIEKAVNADVQMGIAGVKDLIESAQRPDSEYTLVKAKCLTFLAALKDLVSTPPGPQGLQGVAAKK